MSPSIVYLVHLCLNLRHDIRVGGEQKGRPREHSGGGLVTRHKHGHQVVTQLLVGGLLKCYKSVTPGGQSGSRCVTKVSHQAVSQSGSRCVTKVSHQAVRQSVGVLQKCHARRSVRQ